MVATLALLGGLSACTPQQAPPAQDAAPAAAATPATAPPPAVVETDGERLRLRADAALQAQRLVAPAGDNAVEYYLALRERGHEEAAVAAALQELQPYVLIAAERALAEADLSEAQRLLDLLARTDAQAPALPRLREQLQGAHQAQAARVAQLQAEGERQALQRAQAEARAAAARTAAAAPTAAAPVAAPPVVAAAAPPQAPPPSAEPVAPPPSAPVARAPAPARPLPRLLNDSPPRYPLSAFNRRIEGSVRIAFTIQPDGSVSAPTLVSSTPPGVFDEAALAAVSRWRFEAGGERVSTVRTLTFRLPKG
ncbi:energy transducer TonB [Lysobacter silvisoli]|uniref:Protein TonB n=1 Tax=Lysobacter silvisoli TaxID=2293254 RepID=A0A371K0M1_9GAMM|nr:energy transducer TonB [Lysobacter silvisoli]